MDTGKKRYRRVGLGASLLAVISVALLVGASPATASTYPVANGEYDGTCISGSFHGQTSALLSNGALGFSDCYSGGKVTTAAVNYRKVAGSTITAHFGWQFSNTAGTAFLNGDTGPGFTQSSGTTKHEIFYYAGLARPSGYPCLRGVLYVGADTFHTKIIC
jgi:hypothetical protein